jgi:hypothetical protein
LLTYSSAAASTVSTASIAGDLIDSLTGTDNSYDSYGTTGSFSNILYELLANSEFDTDGLDSDSGLEEYLPYIAAALYGGYGGSSSTSGLSRIISDISGGDSYDSYDSGLTSSLYGGSGILSSLLSYII